MERSTTGMPPPLGRFLSSLSDRILDAAAPEFISTRDNLARDGGRQYLYGRSGLDLSCDSSGWLTSYVHKGYM